MNMVFSKTRFVCTLTFFDDCLIYSPSASQHFKDLEQVFDLMIEYHCVAKAEKCKFFFKKGHFLGHIVSSHGIEQDPDKIKAILQMHPSNPKEMLSFISTASFHRKFIQDFARTMRPLREITLLRKWNGKFTKAQKEAYDFICLKLTTAPILAFPDWDAEFTLSCDGAKIGLGAALTQVQNKQKRVIQYISRCTRPNEKKYHSFELEALCLVWAVGVFRVYLIARPFIVLTDQRALTRTFAGPIKTGRLVRWALQLQDYVFSIHYRPGKYNTADGLSRCPLPSTTPYDSPPIEALYEENVRQKDIDRQPWLNVAAISGTGRLPHLRIYGDEIATAGVALHQPPSMTENALETVKHFQQKSKEIEKIVKNLEEAPPGKGIHNFYTIKNNIVYRKIRNKCLKCKCRCKCIPDDDTTCKRRHCNGTCKKDCNCTCTCTTKELLRIPKALIQETLWYHHGLPITGHLGRDRTLELIRRHYWWPNMAIHVKKWIRACKPCCRRKTPKPNCAGLFGTTQVGEPFRKVAADHVVGLPTTLLGNRYLYTMMDVFTRFPQASPVPDLTAETAARALWRDWISIFGIPEKLITDCHKSFTGNLFKELCKIMGIKKLHTSPHTPRQIGSLERFHRFLGQTMTFFINKHHTDWDVVINAVLWVYRISCHATTGISPFMAVFGRDPMLPSHLFSPEPATTLTEYVANTRTILKEIYLKIRATQSRASEKNREIRNQKRTEASFFPGDTVFVYENVGVRPDSRAYYPRKNQTRLAKKFLYR